MSPHSRFVELWSDLFGASRLRLRAPGVHFRVPRYENEALLSMHLVRPADLSSRRAAAMKADFRNRFGPKGVYLSVILPDGAARSALDKRLAAAGFAAPEETRVVYFHRPRPLSLPAGCSAEIGPFLDASIFKAYSGIMERCFPGGAVIARKNRQLTRTLGCEVKTVIVRDRRRRPVAAGCVMISGDSSGMFGGAVLPAWRRKGVWTALVSLRQAAARAAGALGPALLTSNPAILREGDEGFRLLTYRA